MQRTACSTRPERPWQRGLIGLVLASFICALAAVTGAAPAQAAFARSADWPTGWSSPLGTSTVSITTNFGAFSTGCPNADTTHDYTRYLIGGRKEHLGLDIDTPNVPTVTNVYAIGAGTVIDRQEDWPGTALFVSHTAGDGSQFLVVYGHLKNTPANGTVVAAGTKVGEIYDDHLHFGIKPGTGASAPGTATSPGTGDCIHQPSGTVDPIPYLDAHPATASGVPWNFETLDGDANSLLGNTGDLGRNPAVITYNNALHIFHYDATAGVLRHDWSDASGWHQQIVDGGGGYNTGATPTAVVFNGALHVFYNTPGNGQLRHAWGASGSTWTKETLDGPGNVGVSGNITASVGQSPAAVVSGTTLHVFYTDVTGGNLRYGKISVGSGWTLQTLDGAPGTLGNWNAYTGIDPAVTLYNGTVQVLYYDSQYGNLRHAWLSGSSWFFENLEGDPGSVSHFNSDIGRNPTITALSTGLQAFYRDAQYGNLRHAWTDAAGWHFENLDGDVGSVSHREAVTGFTPAAVASGGQLQLFYYEQSGGNLRHAFTDASGWHFEDLDGSGGQPAGRLSTDVGLDPAVTLFGSVQVFYYDLTSGNLRHTWSQ